MPTYSYACTECDNRFDVVQAFTDQSLTVCPACSGRLRKLFSAVGIVFKGSGFYRNDSRSGPGHQNGSPAKGEGNGSSDSKSTDTKSTDTKSTESKPTNGKSSEKASGADKKNGSADKSAGSKATSSSASSAKSGASTS
ncbi:MAG: FmdB family zinc ribbon protein [Mycobacteriaceae bacterium]